MFLRCHVTITHLCNILQVLMALKMTIFSCIFSYVSSKHRLWVHEFPQSMLLSKNKICYIKVGCKPRGSTLHGLVSIMPYLLLQAYELREYDASNWVSVNMVDKRQMFMKLFGYIRGANTKGKIFLNIRT